MDTRHEVETPEGIDLSADLAGPIPRAIAFAIDFAIRVGIYMVLAMGVAFLNEWGLGLLLIAVFLLTWAYPVFFEVMKGGQTPGKKSLGLVVVNQDLTPIRLEASVIRNLLRTVDFLPGFYLFGISSMCLSGKFQRLGDMAAGTIVIYRPTEIDLLDLPQTQPEPPPTGLSEPEQVALRSFSRRHKALSNARQEELASILSPITEASGKAAVPKVQGMGNWLAGKR